MVQHLPRITLALAAVVVTASCAGQSVADRDRAPASPTTTAVSTPTPPPTSPVPIPVDIRYFVEFRGVTDALLACNRAPGTQVCQDASQAGTALAEDVRRHIEARPDAADFAPALDDLDSFAGGAGLLAAACDGGAPDYDGKFCSGLAAITGITLSAFQSALDEIE